MVGEAGDVLGEVALLIRQLLGFLKGTLKVAGGVPVINYLGFPNSCETIACFLSKTGNT